MKYSKMTKLLLYSLVFALAACTSGPDSVPLPTAPPTTETP